MTAKPVASIEALLSSKRAEQIVLEQLSLVRPEFERAEEIPLHQPFKPHDPQSNPSHAEYDEKLYQIWLHHILPRLNTLPELKARFLVCDDIDDLELTAAKICAQQVQAGNRDYFFKLLGKCREAGMYGSVCTLLRSGGFDWLPSGDDIPKVGEGANLSYTSLAKKWGLNAEALRRRLETWRKKHAEGWDETSNKAGHASGILYSEAAVYPVIEKMLTKQARNGGQK